MPQPKVNIAGSDGSLVGVTSNRLDVNATIGVGSSTFTTYAQDTSTTSASTTGASSFQITASCSSLTVKLPTFFSTTVLFLVYN